MSRSEIVPRKRRSLGLSTSGTTEMSLARINRATSALVAPAAATNGSGIMISRASMARNVSARPRLLHDLLEASIRPYGVEPREPQPEPQGRPARLHALEQVDPPLLVPERDER